MILYFLFLKNKKYYETYTINLNINETWQEEWNMTGTLSSRTELESYFYVVIRYTMGYYEK